MKVAELITQLEKENPNDVVLMENDYGKRPIYIAAKGINEMDGYVILSDYIETDFDITFTCRDCVHKGVCFKKDTYFGVENIEDSCSDFLINLIKE